jgi:uncharacterized membrane protein
MWWLILGCSGEEPTDDTGRPVDSDSADSGGDPAESGDSADAFCADAPTLAWSNFGEGFMRESCQGCHASTAEDRHDAPEEITFDTVDQCWTWADDILRTATGEDPSMPPRGGVTDDDRVRLEWWLRCGTPGT